MRLNLLLTLVVLVFVCGGSVPIAAQGSKARPSPQAKVAQTVGVTEISIDYSRPSAKGRVLFGPDGIVKYKEVWMPGANEASYIKLGEDVLIGGMLIKTGRYSIWTIPGEEEWTVIFSKDWNQWHTQYPGKEKDALRIKVKRETGIHMEFLTFYFPKVTPNSATINLHWGKTIIPLEIKLAKDK